MGRIISADTHRLNMERKWAPLEMSTAPGSDRPEVREAHLRAVAQRELGWTDQDIATYWAGFLGAIEWYSSRMTGGK